MNASSATIAIVITLAHTHVIDFPMACAFVLGANIGTTINAPLAALGNGYQAVRAALIHVLFNTIGAIFSVILFKPILQIVERIVPSGFDNENIALQIAAFHTVFNVLATVVFMPFVKQFAALVSWMVKDTDDNAHPAYKLDYNSRISPELNIVRAEKELATLAEIVFNMYKTLRQNILGSAFENISNIKKTTADNKKIPPPAASAAMPVA
jgi:phosphate:Na+ symporter